MARIFLVAGEPSGDELGAELIAALNARDPSLVLSGIGGPLMAKSGVSGPVDISDLAIFGLSEAIPAWKRVVAKAEATAAFAATCQPDIAILIDSWGFTLRVAHRLRKKMPGLKIVKMVGPQVWATRPGRAKTVAETYDALFCIHDFEVPFYEPYGLPCTIIGNPAIGRVTKGDGAAFRKRYGLENQRLLLLLLGSRRAEIANVAPILEAATERLAASRADLKVVCVVSPAVAELVNARAKTWQFPFILIESAEEKADAFAACDAALACSGTVTTEVGLQGTPVVTGYRIGWLSWLIARLFLFKAPFITLMNVAAAREVAPEFIQTRMTVANLVRAASPLLDDTTRRAAQVSAQNGALQAMGQGGPSAAEVAADAVLEMVSA